MLTIVSTSLFAQVKPISSVPFSFENNGIYVHCKVNETDSVKFLFDTGADGTSINKESLAKLNLKVDGASLNTGSNGSNEVETSSANEIKMGDISRKDVLLAIIPFDTDDFDGVMGTDLMKGNIIEIDYNKQVLNFYDRDEKGIDYTGYTKLKLSVDHYPTLVKSSIIVGDKKYTGLFGLDTGADDALTLASPFAKKNDFVTKMSRIGTASFLGSNGSEYEMPIVLCPEVKFADKHLYQVPTALSSVTEGIDATDKFYGFYGNALLKKFNIILDYDAKRIYFKLNKNLYSEFFE